MYSHCTLHQLYTGAVHCAGCCTGGEKAYRQNVVIKDEEKDGDHIITRCEIQDFHENQNPNI